ncbi:MAG: peptidase [Clostridiales bacterium]|nr:peptidase [Clostridiales bacterium]
MNVLISADMEGTCGITDWSETERSTPQDYSYFQQQMSREAAAACEGALAGGADGLLVRDAHDSARNLNPLMLPRQARVLRGWSGDPLSMVSGLDRERFDAVLFTGYHAWAASPGSPLAHTMNTRNEYVLLNGTRMSEFQLNAYTAGYYGARVPFLSGDKELCDFARTLIPDIVTVPVNEGRGGAVLSMHPDEAVAQIRAGAEEAVRRADRCPVRLPDRFEAVVRFQTHETAFHRSFYPGAGLEDGKCVLFSCDDWFEMLRFFHFVLSA